MEQLTWTEAADTLRSGDKVIFIQFFDMGSVLIPKGTVAGVRDNERWSRLSKQIFRVDKWSLCQG
jgi:hypothetical protein